LKLAGTSDNAHDCFGGVLGGPPGTLKLAALVLSIGAVFLARLNEVGWSLALFSKKPVFDGRTPISREGLETAITEVVKKIEPGCEGLAGVIVMHQEAKSSSDTNWTLRGVRFGKADREKASKAIAAVVEQSQRDFYLADAPSAPKR
jgi:hypothetical protein